MWNETKIFQKFLNEEECSEFLDFAKKNFEKDNRTDRGWHARVNRDSSFEQKIHHKLNKILNSDLFHITWINLTEYENGRELKFHKDSRSNQTFTILLTDKFIGGEFLIEDKTYTLEKGDCITFNGMKLNHGVSAVINGYRAALNVWIKKGTRPFL